MVALVEYLEREVREDRTRSLSHPAVIVRIAPAAKREVDGLLERTQVVEVESRRPERRDKGAQTSRASRHPRRRWTRWRWRRRHARGELDSDERRHHLRRRERRDPLELSPNDLLLEAQIVVAHPGGLDQREAEQT